MMNRAVVKVNKIIQKGFNPIFETWWWGNLNQQWSAQNVIKLQ